MMVKIKLSFQLHRRTYFFRWVLNTIDKMALSPHPLISLLPLGTGNDLGRTLGYGSGNTNPDAKVSERQIAER